MTHNKCCRQKNHHSCQKAEFSADFKFFDVGLEKRNRTGKRLKAKALIKKCKTFDICVHVAGVPTSDICVHVAGVPTSDIGVHVAGVPTSDICVHVAGVPTSDICVHVAGVPRDVGLSTHGLRTGT